MTTNLIPQRCLPEHSGYRYNEQQLHATCTACGVRWDIPAEATNSAIVALVQEQLRDRFQDALPASLLAGDVDLSTYAAALTDQRTDPWIEVSRMIAAEVDEWLQGNP